MEANWMQEGSSAVEEPSFSVLIVDDDATFVSITKRSLSRAGLVCESVTTGECALVRLQRSRYDAVLLDLLLPDTDGVAFLAKARAVVELPPVVLISGAGTIGSAVAAMKLGASDFLEKPVDMIDLVETIRSVVLGNTRPSDEPHASPVEELARLVAKVAQATADVRRIGDWAKIVHSTSQTLYGRCARVGVRPKQALDLGRLLRTTRDRSELRGSLLLDALDHRTVASLAGRAGLSVRQLLDLDTATFLRRQRIVECPELIEALGRLMLGPSKPYQTTSDSAG